MKNKNKIPLIPPSKEIIIIQNIFKSLKILVISSLCLILGVSCQENKNRENQKTFSKQEIATDFKVKLVLSDTIFTNQPYNGEIIFESPLDSITTSFSNPKFKRYVVFRLSGSENYSAEKNFYVDSLQEYRFGAIDNRTIPFYGLTFSNSEVSELRGLIEDIVLIDTFGGDKMRLIEQTVEFYEPIKVRE